MYLIVDRAEGLARVPDPLLGQFGTPEPSIVFLLTPQRTLARAQAPEVLEAIERAGFYLQMPPPEQRRDPASGADGGSAS
jgi:uncharacterized protein YcgL (UPF0745 family)